MLSAEDIILTFVGFNGHLDSFVLGIFLTVIPMFMTIFGQDPKASLYYYGTRVFFVLVYLGLLYLSSQEPAVGWTQAFIALCGISCENHS